MKRGCPQCGFPWTGRDLKAYWALIDADPEVQRRREEWEEAVREGRTPAGAIYPSEWLAERRNRGEL